MIDLALIARTFEGSANETERCIERVGLKDPVFVSRKRREIFAVRKCIETLRTPGITHEAALEAITVACGAFS
jgi:hypothetical protein